MAWSSLGHEETPRESQRSEYWRQVKVIPHQICCFWAFQDHDTSLSFPVPIHHHLSFTIPREFFKLLGTHIYEVLVRKRNAASAGD